jgi:hypothetical protein
MSDDASRRRHDLVGTRLPRGEFTIDPDDHRAFCDAVFASPWTRDDAHPSFLHLVAHIGKGMPLPEFFALIGTSLDAGVTFGEGQLEYERPLRIGETYAVQTTIAAVESKTGRRRGRFDVVTVRSDVRDGAGTFVGSSREAYIVPVAEET